MNEKSLTIRKAAIACQVSEMYIRKMIKQGKIETSKVADTANTWHHEISGAELARFKARSSIRTSREDGRNKFVAYMNAAEEAKVRQLLKDNALVDVERLISRANSTK